MYFYNVQILYIVCIYCITYIKYIYINLRPVLGDLTTILGDYPTSIVKLL